MKRKKKTLTTGSRDLLQPDGEQTVLVAVVGMSPAIITETVWALAHESRPVIPDRIVVITTTRGREAILRSLFTPVPRFKDKTAWETLCQTLVDEYGEAIREKLRFGTTGDDIRVITTTKPGTNQSVELEDIRTPQDSEAAAEFILEQLRAYLENPDIRVIASLAGGRKTMSALLYACMCLLGREKDRTTHVLVSEPYETIPEFWYPAQPGGPIADREGNRLHPADARIELADVPFVPLRNLFERELGRHAGTFRRLMAACRKRLRELTAERLSVAIYTERPELDVNGYRIQLNPAQHALMLFLARRARKREPAFGSYKEAIDPLIEWVQETVQAAAGLHPNDWRARLGQSNLFKDVIRGDPNLIDHIDQEVRRLLTNLRATLQREAGEAGYLLAERLPKRGRFSLDLRPDQIQIRERPDLP